MAWSDSRHSRVSRVFSIPVGYLIRSRLERIETAHRDPECRTLTNPDRFELLDCPLWSVPGQPQWDRRLLPQMLSILSLQPCSPPWISISTAHPLGTGPPPLE